MLKVEMETIKTLRVEPSQGSPSMEDVIVGGRFICNSQHHLLELRLLFVFVVVVLWLLVLTFFVFFLSED